MKKINQMKFFQSARSTRERCNALSEEHYSSFFQRLTFFIQMTRPQNDCADLGYGNLFEFTAGMR
jgi:hypothetical protein